jgi:hypothetical protein
VAEEKKTMKSIAATNYTKQDGNNSTTETSIQNQTLAGSSGSHSAPPSLPPGVSAGPFLEWDVFAAAKAMHLKPDAIRFKMADSRMVSALVADYLDNHGFASRTDAPSRFLIEQQGKLYRLSVASGNLCLAPSRGSNVRLWREKMNEELERIDGWIVVFLCDLPNGPTYIFDLGFAEMLLERELLDDKWAGSARKIWKFIHRGEANRSGQT